MEQILEAQRYGRNKSTLVNGSYISGGEYKKKFDKITNNKDFSRILYNTAKEMLFHRSGTLYEDMYWFDADTGCIIAKEINSIEEEQILYSETINKAIEGKSNIITMHTHPYSMPPSIADFNSVKEHNYRFGIVLGHDGKIFVYKSAETVTKVLYNLYVADYYNLLQDEYEAQIEALKELEQNYEIAFWEVT
jgi:proteasome lid subunit RPN8/RPN11